VTGRRHAADVYRYALAMSGSSVDAEDIAQTALAEEQWVAQGRPAPSSPRKRLLDIAHDICRRRLDDGVGLSATPVAATACFDAELALTRRADGRLRRRERRALREHLGSCPDCPQLVDELLAQREAFRALAQSPVPRSFA
jgi:DNA-directed RNA polymerase specialized sigma24 family protein